ncbi:kinesin [Chloropicon primus]|uniref:Kinesin n=1 Tax=Chloropicon primus TaxID=1764295 RepID=A0A5B8MSH6_9CHLO|nr:kinesin [Chloropicon primus]UPR01518.1 kinesin [Chloropicon primus]|eukprot:QDZ22302.1 kinesin [Chloropicon primus]
MDKEGDYESDNSRVNVFVRVRPVKGKEEKATRQAGDKSVRISVTKKSEKTFVYDRLFGEKDGQQAVYDVVGRPVIQDVLKGYNGCIMAYGQTGAGKTHSLLNMANGSAKGELNQPGLVPRIVTDLYIAMAADFMGMFTVSVAMCQIYNEQIDDLLKPKNTNLRLTMTNEKSWEVEGLSWYKCKTPEYLVSVISNGRKRLVYAETEMNKHSSRSHAVLMIKVQRHNRSDVVKKEQMEKESAQASDSEGEDCSSEAKKDVVLRGRQGILSIIDLAGSERVKKSKSSGIQFTEAKKINNSLLVLGQCVQALAFKKGHVPYRDSVLTKFLEPSLSGTARVNLLVCVAPERIHANESISTLEFAYRAMSVATSPTVNEMTVCTSPKELIADLASAASVVKLEQTEALQRITGEKMQMEEELQALKGEHEVVAKSNQANATELKDVKAKYADLSEKFSALEKDTVRITGEALFMKQDLKTEREKAASEAEAAHESSVRLTRENGQLKKQLADALATIERLQGDLATQQIQLKDHIERIQWIETSIGLHESGAAEIENKMQSMVDILNQTSTKIEGLEGALTEARAKAQVLGQRCNQDKLQWNDEKGILHALVSSMQKKIAQYEEEQRRSESQACCSAITEQILWTALTSAKEREIETERTNVKQGVEVSERRKAAHIDSLDEWLKCGIPVIKWGRNKRPYNRLVRVSSDGKFLEWVKMKKGSWLIHTEGVRRFALKDVTSINTSEAGKSADDILYTVQVGLPERVVRMDLASSKGFLWFETLKARGLNIR